MDLFPKPDPRASRQTFQVDLTPEEIHVLIMALSLSGLQDLTPSLMLKLMASEYTMKVQNTPQLRPFAALKMPTP